MVILSHLTPSLVTINYRVFLQGYGFQNNNQLVQILLAFLQLIVKRVLGYGHAHVCQPLMEKAEGDILHIHLIG